MSIKDALEISLIGITVVFIGLILTSLLIASFGGLKRVVNKLKTDERKRIKEINITNSNREIPSEIIAVISTVIEIEKKLRISLRGTKFTFDDESQRGWSEEGRMILNPFEGGKIK